MLERNLTNTKPLFWISEVAKYALSLVINGQESKPKNVMKAVKAVKPGSGRMPRPVAKVVTNEKHERTIEGNEGVEGVEKPRRVIFTECENKLKTKAKKVFLAGKLAEKFG